MFLVGNTLLGVATVLDYALTFYSWIVIARALISWVNPDPWNQSFNSSPVPLNRFWPDPTAIGLGDGHGLVAIDHHRDHLVLQIAVVQSIKDLAVRMN